MKKHLGKSLTLAILLSVCGGYTMFGNVGVAEATTYYGTSIDNNDATISGVTRNNDCGVTTKLSDAYKDPCDNDFTVTGTNNIRIYGGYIDYGKALNNDLTLSGNETSASRVTGGYSDKGETSKNTVNICEGAIVTDEVYGGCIGGDISDISHIYSIRLGNALKNTIVISDRGTVVDSAFGGFTLNGEVSENKITIEREAKVSNAYGGYTAYGTADGNNVTVKEGCFVDDIIIGGYSQREGDAIGNIVNISGSTVIGKIIGGYTKVGLASKNIVTISNGAEITNNVIGGFAETNNANENIVNIAEATINGDVFGACHNSNIISKNTINLIGKNGMLNVQVGYIKDEFQFENLTGNEKGVTIKGNVYGGYNDYIKKADSTGSILNVVGTDIKVGNIAGFEEINFVLPKTSIKGKDMLTVNDTGNAATNISTATVVVKADAGTELKKDDTVNLIHKKDAGKLEVKKDVIDKDVKFVAVTSGVSAFTAKAKLTLEQLDGNEVEVGNDLVLTITESEPNPDPGPEPDYTEQIEDNKKNMVETRALGMAIVNEGADFMAEQGMTNAKMAAKDAAATGDKDMVPFAALGGGKMRYNSGSHVDSKSWHGAVGVAKEIGDLTIGIAVDHGKSSFDSYNDGGAKGSGDSKATGASVIAEVKKASGVHFDGSIRAGRVKNDYNATLYIGMVPFATHYNDSSTYYGLSLGGGKEFAVSDKNVIDVYGRYFWTHTNDSDTTDNYGNKLSFEAINSHRLRIGSRFTHEVNNISKLYAGLAWQHEFKGDARATVAGTEAPSPSLKGNSGMLELGWKLQANKNLDLDLGATGYTGKQKGASLNLALNFKF